MSRALTIIEAVTPKQLAAKGWMGGDHALAVLYRLGFRKASTPDYLRLKEGRRNYFLHHYKSNAPRTSVSPLGPVERRWDVTVMDGNEETAKHTMLGDGALLNLLRSYNVLREAMTPKEMLKKLPAQVTVDQESTLRGLRDLASVYVVEKVMVDWGRGKLTLRIHEPLGYGRYTLADYWTLYSSRGVLGQSLRQWRNLRGVPLEINGVPSGEVDYRNPALVNMDDFNPPPGHVPPIGEALSPKEFFKKVHDKRNKAYDEILQHAPEKFRAAHARREEAEWDPEMGQFADWVPSRMDDYVDPDTNEERVTWTKYAYYPIYRTENGVLYEVIMSVDTDGDHEFEEEAEVGTDEHRQLYVTWLSHEGLKEAWNDYWAYVAETGDDALGEIFVPQQKYEEAWLARFTEEDGKLKLSAVRPVGRENLHDEISDLDKIPQEVKDYCLLDKDGYTEADVADVIREGGKKDKKGRWLIRFTVDKKQPVEDKTEFNKRYAQQQLER